MTSTYRDPPINFGEEGQKKQQIEANDMAETELQNFPQIQKQFEPSKIPRPISSPAQTLCNMVEQPTQQYTCVVCGDESDGLHFGQCTCKACAAFFRRTVSMKYNYSCKKGGNCIVNKEARNMCRACRFKKCMSRGMLVSAVQPLRDALGKRKDQRTFPPFSTSSASSNEYNISASGPEMKMIKSEPEDVFFLGRFSTPSSTSSALSLSPLNTSAGYISTSTKPGTTFGVKTSHSRFDHEAAKSYPSNNAQHHQLFRSNSDAIINASHQILPAIQEPCSSKKSSTQPFENRGHLSRMLEGYHHFLALRKASYTLLDDYPQFLRRDGDAKDIPQSNFGATKKCCKIEISLLMSTVEKYFLPFKELPMEDKNKIFEGFYCLFSNAERAFRTYKTFDDNDDRLLMPDGGYIKLDELDKFYTNSPMVLVNPVEVARIFENAMRYLVNVVVAYFRNISMTEMELMVLFGMFLWTDSSDISAESLRIAMQIRKELIVELHNYYQSQLGLSGAEITYRVANLFLLLPKLEHITRLLKEDFNIAELFNMLHFEKTESQSRSQQSSDKGNAKDG